MKSLTISESFRQAIGERTVTRAFFSTYCFEPDFFELEVMPLLLQQTALSTDDTLRYHQLQVLMSLHRNQFAVAYDLDVFNPEFATRLEVDYIPVRVPGACQHSKLAVIEVLDAGGAASIILAAGSFNLTKAGWWTNIEVGHWVELNQAHAPRNIVEPLERALVFFQRNRPVPVLATLRERLESWKPGPKDPGCTFYFSGAGIGRQSFPDLLRHVRGGPLEIVSPFFAEQGDNAKIASFLKRYDPVALLLPTDEQGVATLTRPVHDQLSSLVNWCQWNRELRNSFGLHADGVRKLHAKIYAGTSWCFVGSVNLSQKAFHDNVEAGFLLQGTAQLKLLRSMPRHQLFAPVAAAEASGCPDATAIPPVELVFDWRSGLLEAFSPVDGALTLFDPEGVPHGTYLLHADTPVMLRIEGLAARLGRSSLVAACWTTPDGSCSDRRTFLVSQRQVYCRPGALPQPDVHDLLRIFQNLDYATRLAMITELAARQARLSKDGLSSNEFLPPLPPEEIRSSFFSEFSEVNGAFWQLKNKLKQAHEAGREEELAYYLDGEQPDSLTSLAKALSSTDNQRQTALIVRYLTLLSMDELLATWRPGSELGLRVQALIGATENDGEFSAMADRDAFLAWIKEKFSMPVRRVNCAHVTGETMNGQA